MNIGVIMGGVSSEREVSMKTGKAMVQALKQSKSIDCNVYEIIISEAQEILNIPDNLCYPNLDFVLLALHGKFGEDGTIQSFLDIKGIPYSGCNAISSALCMDKNLTKTMLRSKNIPTANWVVAKDASDKLLKEAYELKYPVFVKPNSGGSSVATFMIKDKMELKNAILECLKWDTEVMIEEFVEGSEFTCAMMNGEVLPIVKIDAKGEFFDFSSKYEANGANEYVVEFDNEIQEKINNICKATWDVLKCDVYARVDIIMKGDNINVLEVNTLPGMTPTSLFPKSANAAGMDMSDLLEKIIKDSMSVRCNEKKLKELFRKREKELFEG
ncbi:D-alanine--D-alanine ligase (plasmid) [Clostridium perfringens]